MTNDTNQPFNAAKKNQWLVAFRSLGFGDEDIVKLDKSLRFATDELPQDYLDRANTMMADSISIGELMPRLTWLLDAYTPFPRSNEYSARLIVKALERATKHYPPHTVPIRYTTKLNPKETNFPELTAFNYIEIVNQGTLDILGAIGVLVNYEIVNIYFVNMLRANSEFIEFELVFSFEADKAKMFIEILNSKHMSITYDKANRVLTIDEHSIEFKSGLQADLCRTLFTGKSFNKEWAADEIYKSWGLHDDERPPRLTIYQTGRKLNSKIERESKGQLPDLVEATTKSATINPKYRKFVSKC
jgi:hypothetical protein